MEMDSWLGVTVPDSRIDLNQSFTFSFERDWKERDVFHWLKTTFAVTWISSGIYLIIIFPLRKYMENRRPFDLRRGMVLWSATLAIFSIIGTARTAPERWYTVSNFGWSHSVCNIELYTGPIALWYGLFITSKIYEFGDTIFIILRKQKLIFLHWYHHVTVLIFSWYLCSDVQIFARWFLVMNYFVHAVMYSYYTLRALKIRVPKMVAMLVTVLQILQVIQLFRKCIPFLLTSIDFHFVFSLALTPTNIFSFFRFLKCSEDLSPFCRTTDTTVLDFW